ncbi:MAG: Gfo/Idh/MocA family oxidoreductase [Propionicimonas sp.]
MSLPATLPVSRVPDPRQAPPLNWGIMAPGGIATAFARSLRTFTRQRLVAVGSRSAERAAAFAAEFDVPRAYGSYEALLADPSVQIVYVASPHSEHFKQASMAIEAGKHVLLEKAFTRNAGEAWQLAHAAQAAGVTLMEAMWTRFLPHTDVVRQLLADGALGELETLIADHGQALGPDKAPRLHDPALAGGALLDLGIYPISYAVFALGLPGRVQAVGTLTPTGVDSQVSILMDGFARHPRAQALLSTTLAAKTPTTATISGTAARVELEDSFYMPGPVRLVDPDGDQVVRPERDYLAHQGLCHEAAHFAQLVADDRRESPLLPVAQSVAIIEILDGIREQLGVRYPGE